MIKDKKKDPDKINPKGFDPKKYIEVDPVYNNKNMSEEKSNSVVITFGRFSPPTTGHEKLVNKIKAEAKNRKAVPLVYVSHTYDKKKNPLTYNDKIAFLKTAFGTVVKKSDARSIIEVAKELSSQYDNLIVVVGQDRIAEFQRLLNAYNGKEYNFKKIEIISAGERDPDADDVSGMSASKLRSLAVAKDFEAFKTGLPKKLQSQAKVVYDTLLKGMGLMEDMELNDIELDEKINALNFAQRLKRSMVMKRYAGKIAAARMRAQKRRASPTKLKDRSHRKALTLLRARLSRAKGYGDMSPSEKLTLDKRLSGVPQAVINRIALKQLPAVRKAEQQRMSSMYKSKNEAIDTDERFEMFLENFTQESSVNENYYTGLSKSTAAKRKAHFEKGAAMADNNPAAYEPAPGDARAKTKTSVHTKRFHKLFKKEGTVNTDLRFKMYREKVNIFEDTETYSDYINDLIESVETLFEEAEESLKKKAEQTGISYGILKQVYDRGVAAWKSGHRPGTNPSQWGYARVNSFATKGKGTWGKADSDLAAKVRKEEVEVDEACWTGYKQLGMKKLGKKIVPNCVKEDIIESSDIIKKIIEREMKHKAIAKALKSFSNVADNVDSKDHLHHADKIIKTHGALVNSADLVKLYHRIKNAKHYEKSYSAFDAWESVQVDKVNPNNREYGSDSLVRILKADTPGESVDESFGGGGSSSFFRGEMDRLSKEAKKKAAEKKSEPVTSKTLADTNAILNPKSKKNESLDEKFEALIEGKSSSSNGGDGE